MFKIVFPHMFRLKYIAPSISCKYPCLRKRKRDIKMKFLPQRNSSFKRTRQYRETSQLETRICVTPPSVSIHKLVPLKSITRQIGREGRGR